MKKTQRQHRADELLERAANAADRGTKQGRDQAARLITQSNAVKRGRPIPAYAKDRP